MLLTARKRALIGGLVLALAGAGVAPAAVAFATGGQDRPSRPRTVPVSGEQIPVDVGAGTSVMRGDLVGDWWYLPVEPALHLSRTMYVEAGTEVFKGCIDTNRNGRCGRREPRGELRFAFLYWSSFDQDGQLIRGQCVHPITGGRGAFRGARGLVQMVAVPVGDRVRTTYRGDVELRAVPSEAETPAWPETLAVAGPAASAGRSGHGC